VHNLPFVITSFYLIPTCHNVITYIFSFFDGGGDIPVFHRGYDTDWLSFLLLQSCALCGPIRSHRRGMNQVKSSRSCAVTRLTYVNNAKANAQIFNSILTTLGSVLNLICGSSLTAVTGCRKNPQRKERSVETETARKQQTYVTVTCAVNIERCQHRDVLCYKKYFLYLYV